MKQLLMALLFPVALSAQKKDVVKLSHTNYTTYFSKSKKYPVRVEWWVTKARISCVKGTPRTDKFIPDPLLQDDTNLQKDYTASGFDRGHLAPAADFKCGTAQDMAETFYFSNMAPQYPGMNRGQWKSLEEHTRALAQQHDSVFVQAGCVGVRQHIARVAVPTHCWKIVDVRATKQVTSYVFENVALKTQSLTSHVVSKDSVMKLRK
jgi:endonuclease G